LFSRRRVGFAPGVGEERRAPRVVRAASGPGACFLLGTFLCTSKEKYLARGARNRKYSSYIDQPRRRREQTMSTERSRARPFKPWIPAFAGMTQKGHGTNQQNQSTSAARSTHSNPGFRLNAGMTAKRKTESTKSKSS